MNLGKSEITSYPRQWYFGLLSIVVSVVCRPMKGCFVLTSFHGDGYRGNTRVLFERLQDEERVDTVWLSRNRRVVEAIRQRYGADSAFLTHSFRGMYRLARANAVCLTHGTSDFPFMRLNRRSLIVQTYHGLPTKRGEFMPPSGEERVSWLHSLVLRFRFNPITCFLSSSPYVSDLFSRRFGLPKPRFYETGFPVYDILNKPAMGSLQGTDSEQGNSHSPFILYAPTFRRQSRTRWFPFEGFSVSRLHELLERHDAYIGLRPHPNDRATVERYTGASDRIVLADETRYEDVVKLLTRTSVIVTDYSGIYLEGLLRDIPAVFVPYDLGHYERGLPFRYTDVTPGPKVCSQQPFFDALEEALTGATIFADERRRVRELFFPNPDGKATDRVIALLIEKAGRVVM